MAANVQENHDFLTPFLSKMELQTILLFCKELVYSIQSQSLQNSLKICENSKKDP